MRQKQPESLSRRAMKLLCRLLGVILAVMLAVTVCFQFLLQQVNRIDPGPAAQAFSPSSLTPVQLDNSQPESPHPQIGGSGSDIINILLIGQDRREGDQLARSDSMILCTFHKKTKQLTMTSFLRDLYVQIPGFPPNRINAAYAQGGTSLLTATLKQNFGLHIDGSVEVDFSQFSGVIDLLGGVEIELRQDEANVINLETGSTLGPGKQTLNGAQALAYSRIRKLDSDGDFSRTGRQRKVLQALLDSYKDIRMSDLVPLLSKVLPMITTDLDNGKLLMCALEILPILPQAQIRSQHIPAAGTYTDQTIDGMWVLCADMEAVRHSLRESLLGSP